MSSPYCSPDVCDCDGRCEDEFAPDPDALFQCATCALQRTRAQIEAEPCPCGSLRHLLVADLQDGQAALDRLVAAERERRKGGRS